MLIARLRAEAVGETFDFPDLGITWLANEDIVCAITEEGEVLMAGDVFYATVVLLWSMVMGAAEIEGVDPSEIVAKLALGLARHEPA